jgi:hypothetical protein
MDPASSLERSHHRYFVLHTFPDADCISASWLAVRYLFPRLFPQQALEPYFVPFNGIDPLVLARATAVFDIGREFDPKRLRFDHHQAEDPRATCAARMVWQYLTIGDDHNPPLFSNLMFLDPLIDLIQAGDADIFDARGFAISRTLGFHALLTGFRALREQEVIPAANKDNQAELVAQLDRETLYYGWQLLDTIAAGLQRRHELTAQLRDNLVYQSADGLVWGLDNAPPHAAPEAFKQGAQLVVATSMYHLPLSYVFEVWGAPEQQNLDVQALMQQAAQEMLRQGNAAAYHELQLFYMERTYAGRGSPKAPNPVPVQIGLIDLVRQLDRLWER